MSVKVIYNNYSDICGRYMYGKQILELPAKIIDKIDEYLDGVEFEEYGNLNPDNVVVNMLVEIDTEEVLTYTTKMLNMEEYEELSSKGKLLDYIERNQEEIKARLGESYLFLGYEGNTWYCLN